MSLFAGSWRAGEHSEPMKNIPLEQLQQKTVCGQAHAVFESLSRSRSLPGDLSLTIEEILERAWEIAYRRQEKGLADNVIAVPHWTFRGTAR